MLTVRDATGVERSAGEIGAVDGLWIDLVRPTAEEVATVERATGRDLPSADDRAAIEQSSRLIRDDDALYLTATVLTGLDGGDPRGTPIAFVLDARHLITVRDETPGSFDLFQHRLSARHRPLDAPLMLVALIDAVSDRLADELETVAGKVQTVSDRLFRPAEPAVRADAEDLQSAIVTIGRLQDRLTKVRESSAGLERVLSFFTGFDHLCSIGDARARADTVRQDLRGLVEEAAYQTGTVQFLLDATLGLINVEQNTVMEIVSVVSVVFVPPTLVASIWGMNFARMPELAEPWGYPLGLGVIALSAVLPYLFFRWKRWL